MDTRDSRDPRQAMKSKYSRKNYLYLQRKSVEDITATCGFSRSIDNGTTLLIIEKRDACFELRNRRHIKNFHTRVCISIFEFFVRLSRYSCVELRVRGVIVARKAAVFSYKKSIKNHEVF